LAAEFEVVVKDHRSEVRCAGCTGVPERHAVCQGALRVDFIDGQSSEVMEKMF